MAPVSVGGRDPTCTQPGWAVEGASAAVPAAVVPMAKHRRLSWQLTAVMSRIPAGRAAAFQFAPPLPVVMIAPCPLDVCVVWPTAVQWRLSLHEIPDR